MTGSGTHHDAPRPAATHRVVDVGGGHVTAATVTLDGGGPVGAGDRGRVEHRSPLPLDSQADREAILDTFALAAGPLVEPGAAWTIAMPGPFDYARGTGTFAGIGKFQSLAGLDLAAAVAERLDTRPERVRFLNDAAAYGIGEWAFGGAARPARLVCLTLGTGIGSAFVHDGDVVTSGPDVPTDGEAHTIRYRGAPLEETVSSRAIQARYGDGDGQDERAAIVAPSERSAPTAAGAPAGSLPTVAEIASRARTGDDHAATVLADAMADLGRAIGPWVQRFAAEAVVVGGAMSRSWPLLERGFRVGLTAAGVSSAVVVRPSSLLDEAPLLGAAAWREREADRSSPPEPRG